VRARSAAVNTSGTWKMFNILRRCNERPRKQKFPPPFFSQPRRNNSLNLFLFFSLLLKAAGM